MKRFLPILVVLGILFAGLGHVVSAAEDGMSPFSQTPAGDVPSCWVYQFEYTTYTNVKMDQPLDDTRYVRVPSGYHDTNGYPIFARGTLHWAGTAYDFPKAGQKQGTYSGTVTAYIDD